MQHKRLYYLGSILYLHINENTTWAAFSTPPPPALPSRFRAFKGRSRDPRVTALGHTCNTVDAFYHEVYRFTYPEHNVSAVLREFGARATTTNMLITIVTDNRRRQRQSHSSSRRSTNEPPVGSTNCSRRTVKKNAGTFP